MTRSSFRPKADASARMPLRRLVPLAGPILLLMAATAAMAHAHLRSATPAAASVAAGPVRSLRLQFSEGVEPAFSSVTLTDAAGAKVPLGPLVRDPANPAVVTAHLAQPLKPGRYTVLWRAVATDTHRTQGSYAFTVRP